jgi:rhomboid protease GluP
MLGILGYQIEREYGTIKYLITYMICGAGGAMLSAFVEMRMNEAPVSVGASGAVFGIFGVMLVMIFKNKRIDGQATALRLVILLVLMVFGNMEEGVDWMAHLGGALMGVMLAFILYRTKKKNNIEGGYYG